MKEKGLTLIELLVVLAITSVIITSALVSVYAILMTNARGNAQVVALTDLNRASLEIKNDLLMAQATNLVDGVPSSSANVTWFDYTSSFGSSFGTDHYASFNLTGKVLQRMRHGITDGGEFLRPQRVCVLERVPGGAVIEVTLTEGRKREVRRICNGLGLAVEVINEEEKATFSGEVARLSRAEIALKASEGSTRRG